MKTKQVVEAYNVLGGAKLTKMEDKDKFTVIKAMRQMKPVAIGYEDFVKDAQEKLKDERFDDMRGKAQKWQEEGDKTALTVDERIEVNAYFAAYNKRVNDCLKEEQEKEVELGYGRLDEEAFGKLVASNDFDVNTILLLGDALAEVG